MPSSDFFRRRKLTLNLVWRLPNFVVIILIGAYQRLLSPLLPPSCRFQPTCSQYARQAFARYSFLRALLLTTWRILRCNPFSRGGYDPLP